MVFTAAPAPAAPAQLDGLHEQRRVTCTVLLNQASGATDATAAFGPIQ